VFACLKTAQPLQGCKLSHRAFLNPGFQSKLSHPTRAARAGTPAWADIRQRFQRYKIFPPNLGFATFCAKHCEAVS
jgi:hypothetical protein